MNSPCFRISIFKYEGKVINYFLMLVLMKLKYEGKVINYFLLLVLMKLKYEGKVINYFLMLVLLKLDYTYRLVGFVSTSITCVRCYNHHRFHLCSSGHNTLDLHQFTNAICFHFSNQLMFFMARGLEIQLTEKIIDFSISDILSSCNTGEF